MSGEEAERDRENMAPAGAIAEDDGGVRHDTELYDRIKDLWADDHEVEIYKEVLRRERNCLSYPGREDVEAMEEPLYRLLGAVALFEDLSIVHRREKAPRRVGLSFLARAMNREVERLYRLYHGHPPGYSE